MPATRGAGLLAGVLAAAGVGHFLQPRPFEAIVPSWAPVSPRVAVAVSGVAELVCAAGLATERAWAGPASAALLLAVWPANIQMAVDETVGRKRPLRLAALWARVPLQLPLLRAALAA